MTTAVLKSAKAKVSENPYCQKTLTGEEFLAAMRNGWCNLKYTKGVFFRAPNGLSMGTNASCEVGRRERIASCCALGAAAYALEVNALKFDVVLPWELRRRIAMVSNDSGSKTAAIRDVTKLVQDWEKR